MYVGYEWQQRVYASMQVQQATKVLQADITQVTAAQMLLLKSINTYFNTSDLRFTSEVSLIRPTELISKTQGVVSPEKLTEDVVSDITLAINSARRAAIDKGLSVDYRDWLQLGKAYETATFLGATSTATLAVESYLEAERLNPTSPIPPYFIGRLYSFARGFEIAEAKLKRAVQLKPNYTEAVTLLNSVSELNKTGQTGLKSSIVVPEDQASAQGANQGATTSTTTSTTSSTKTDTAKTGTTTKR
jgi:tetratricopeptide (TPR) repeat protein